MNLINRGSIFICTLEFLPDCISSLESLDVNQNLICNCHFDISYGLFIHFSTILIQQSSRFMFCQSIFTILQKKDTLHTIFPKIKSIPIKFTNLIEILCVSTRCISSHFQKLIDLETKSQ
ncbi:hypothetical protein KP509_12G021900 [Ceratopteris richardii]|uniref:Uncharacterized protein n=1 Tax=Ceratopteris richardii TaxID=49495 RepID=A0A8T2THB7_CERRI|nr:hypothetical protein KP509_12G021900 [Ceratopteris richardii]